MHFICRNISERKQAQLAMRSNAERLRELSRRLLEVEETERRNINRELHAQTALFRIAQEALNNVAKHARANKVEIALADAHHLVVLTIADDDVGIDPNNLNSDNGWGMTTMRERAEAVGARLRVESSRGAGLRVIVELERAGS